MRKHGNQTGGCETSDLYHLKRSMAILLPFGFLCSPVPSLQISYVIFGTKNHQQESISVLQVPSELAVFLFHAQFYHITLTIGYKENKRLGASLVVHM